MEVDFQTPIVAQKHKVATSCFEHSPGYVTKRELYHQRIVKWKFHHQQDVVPLHLPDHPL